MTKTLAQQYQDLLCNLNKYYLDKPEKFLRANAVVDSGMVIGVGWWQFSVIFRDGSVFGLSVNEIREYRTNYSL